MPFSAAGRSAVITRSEEVRGKLFQQGWNAVGSSAEGRVIAERGIRVE
ncbi:MAG: hypothetical protein QM569_05305 [Acidovorax sp.]